MICDTIRYDTTSICMLSNWMRWIGYTQSRIRERVKVKSSNSFWQECCVDFLSGTRTSWRYYYLLTFQCWVGAFSGSEDLLSGSTINVSEKQSALWLNALAKRASLEETCSWWNSMTFRECTCMRARMRFPCVGVGVCGGVGERRVGGWGIYGYKWKQVW